MNQKINWYIIKKEYIKYLQRFDNKVQNINYYNSYKPYVGIVFKMNEFNYYVPISSVKLKHYKMKENVDFLKLMYKGRILSVINLNNMIPVLEDDAILLKYEDISSYFIFENEKSKMKYIALLNKERKIINYRRNEIIKYAKRIYKIKNKFPDTNISLRCCDFKLLEQKCLEYMKENKNNNKM